jgi:ATP-binding cassette subfamily F protein 3
MKKIGQLTGGEKVRLALCKMFQTKPNLLILDEPTNHMDIMGKQALEQMLQNFKGTVLFVSHDRYFIKQVATEILEFGQEKVSQYHCDYEEYLNEKAKIATESPKVQSPVSQDVSDKKTYYNPGKIKSRLIKQLEKYEKQLQESEEKAASIKIEMMAPELATDYHKLMELQSQLEKEETWQESLLEQIMETEIELEELKNDN